MPIHFINSTFSLFSFLARVAFPFSTSIVDLVSFYFKSFNTSCFLVFIFLFFHSFMYFLCTWIVPPLVLSNDSSYPFWKKKHQGDLYMYELQRCLKRKLLGFLVFLAQVEWNIFFLFVLYCNGSQKK